MTRIIINCSDDFRWGDVPSNYNNFEGLVVGTAIANLIDDAEVATGYALEVVSAFGSNSAAGTSLSPNDIDADAWNRLGVTANGGTSTHEITGLTEGDSYTIEIGANSGNPSRGTDVTVNGVTKTYAGSTQDPPPVPLSFSGTVPANGKITVSVELAATGGEFFGYFDYSDLELTAAPTGPTLDTIPTTAFPGETITLGVTGAEAAQGTGGVTINGEAQAISSWSDTSIDITVVQGDTPYGTGNTVTLTTDGGDTDTGTIELVADTTSGFGYVVMSSPNTSDESSVAFGATPTVVNPDQFEWEDFNDLAALSDPAIPLEIDAEGFVVAVGGEGTFRGRFWDATDSTWGAVETFTAEVPSSYPFSKGIKYAANQNWEWGSRHPMTSMRVRIYK